MILLRQKYYSQLDSEKSVNLGGKRTKYSDMSLKQLKNLANYEEYKEEKASTEKGRKDNRKRDIIGLASFGSIGGLAGLIPESRGAKTGAAGAMAGMATYLLIKIAADANHKEHARLARKELARRGITDLGPLKSLDERNKEVLDDLKRK